MAQAVAGETNRPFVFVEPGAFTNMFIGVGILKVKGLYRKLRRLALRYGGVIVFFDEADALGSRGAAVQGGGGWGFTPRPSPWSTGPGCNGLAYLSRRTVAGLLQGSLAPTVVEGNIGTRRNPVFVGAGMGGGGGMGTLQALLEEMSGLKKPRGFFNRVLRRILGMRPKPPPKYRILHIFATNMPQSLDPAMLRPGRIDRIYKVGYPSKEGRKATFEKYLGEKKHELTPEEIDKLATITPYATGASIKDIVNEALAIAIRDGRETITWNDVIKAKQLSEHGPPDDTEYIERERHAVAIHEACHAVVAYRTKKDAVIDIATIERRGDVGGFVSFIPPEDQFVNWHSELQHDIMSSLASVAGERMFFRENSAGVAGDLQSATAVSLQMQAYLGMGSSLGSHYVTKFGITHGRTPYGAEDGSDRNVMETELGKRVEEMLGTMYERTHNLLEENRAQVLAVAHALEMHKTMSGDDVAAIIEGRQGPLVDGRQYEIPEFAGQVAAYHGEALAAHREHARVKVPLPALPTPSSNGPPGTGDGDVLKADPEIGDGQQEIGAAVGSNPENLAGDGREREAEPPEDRSEQMPEASS